MIIELLVSGLIVAAVPADTTLRVDAGTRLDVENMRGDVTLEAWDRDEVYAGSDDGDRVEAVRTGAVLRIRPAGVGPGADVDMTIRVPRWMDVRVEATRGDVRVVGTEARVEVETVQGEVAVVGGADLIRIESIQGEISVRDSRGRVQASSVNEDIRLERVSGEVFVETTSGDITLREVGASAVRAKTMNGDVLFDGDILPRGHYALATHNGDLVVVLAEDTDAAVSVSTWHGEFESEFPIRFTGSTRDQQFQFTLGSGSARVELESFNGEIQLRRPR